MILRLETLVQSVDRVFAQFGVACRLNDRTLFSGHRKLATFDRADCSLQLEKGSLEG